MFPGGRGLSHVPSLSLGAMAVKVGEPRSLYLAFTDEETEVQRSYVACVTTVSVRQCLCHSHQPWILRWP